jgi:hypothetical protein
MRTPSKVVPNTFGAFRTADFRLTFEAFLLATFERFWPVTFETFVTARLQAGLDECRLDVLFISGIMDEALGHNKSLGALLERRQPATG